MATADQLRQQLAQLQNEYSQASRYGSGAGYAQYVQGQTNLVNQIMQAEQAAAAAPRPGAPAPVADRLEDNRNRGYAEADGRLAELRNDPVDKEIIAALQGRATGEDQPFNEATTNAMFTARAEQANAGQAAAVQRLLRSGLTPGDPAFQSALAELDAGRQGANQNARLNVDMNAGRENYAARGQALGQLGAFNQGRNSGITGQSNYVSNARFNEVITDEQPGARAMSMPSFGEYMNGGQQPSPRPVYQPPPQPRPVQQPRGTGLAVAPNQPGRNYNVGTGSLGQTSGAVATNGGTVGSTYGGARPVGQRPIPQYGTATNLRTGQTRQVPNGQVYNGQTVTPAPQMPRPRPVQQPQPEDYYPGRKRRTME